MRWRSLRQNALCGGAVELQVADGRAVVDRDIADGLCQRQRQVAERGGQLADLGDVTTRAAAYVLDRLLKSQFLDKAERAASSVSRLSAWASLTRSAVNST